MKPKENACVFSLEKKKKKAVHRLWEVQKGHEKSERPRSRAAGAGDHSSAPSGTAAVAQGQQGCGAGGSTWPAPGGFRTPQQAWDLLLLPRASSTWLVLTAGSAAGSGACWGKTSEAGLKRKYHSPPVKYQGELNLSHVRENVEEGAQSTPDP